MKLRTLELFCGIGAASKALKNIGIEEEIVDAVDIDKYAIKSFNAIHGTNFETQDITEWDKDVKDIDLIVHGSPCFLAGEKVNTKDGFKNIENLKIGDIVKSHDGSYNKIIKTMKNKSKEIYDICCSATHSISTTGNHPFYILRNGKKEWIETKDITTKDFMCIPINKEQKELKWEGTKLYYNKHREISNKLPTKSPRFWYLIGRFIGDGWVIRRKERNNNISGIKICCGKHELKDLENKLCNILNYCVVEDRTTYKLQFSNKELGEFCSQFGIGAKSKNIPQQILDLKAEYLEYLLMGIIDSDGCYTNNKYKVSTTSRNLAYNIGELVLKTKRVPYHIYKTTKPRKHIIEGREVNQNDSYEVTWGANYNEKINFVDNDYLYSRVRKINKREEINDVYNIEVENTHTYCVNNVAVHNCQDFSIAGKQQGGDLGSGTRSSLMYETVRIIGKTRPKYVLWENVKNVLSVRHKHNFDNYINAMEMLGYKSYYQVLNAKDYGIPQNRDRVYTISIRNDIANKFEFPNKEILNKSLQEMLEKDVSEKYFVFEKGKQYILKRVGNYTQLIYKDTIIAHCPITALGNANWTGNFVVFEFPPKEELKVKLKDILEKDVDEKYYLSQKMIDRIKNSNFSQEKTRIQQKDICDTLLARDFKDPKCVEVIRKYGIFDEGNSKHQAGSVYDKDGLCPTLDTMQGGWRQPLICVKKESEKVYAAAMRGRYNNNKIEQQIEVSNREYANNITTVQKDSLITDSHKIRKLTPLECWRLMGFDDEDFYKAKAVPTSDTQLYKQAGNSIVVKVLEKIFLNLFKGE